MQEETEYTEENIQGIIFTAGTGKYMIDHSRKMPNPNRISLPSESWSPGACVREFKLGNWKVLSWPLKPTEIINHYEIY